MNLNKEYFNFVEELCFSLGLNTAHDYDGVDTREDLEIYKKSILREIEDLKRKTNDKNKK